jgi:hypothetical protein
MADHILDAGTHPTGRIVLTQATGSTVSEEMQKVSKKS